MNLTSRRALSALSLISILALPAGCATMSDVTTNAPYQAGDGVNITLGRGADARGLVVVGGATASGPGRLVGQFVNDTDSALDVTFATKDGDSVNTTVAAHKSLDLGTETLTLKAVPGKAGDLVSLTITTPADGTNVIDVPILLPHGFYAKYAPTS